MERAPTGALFFFRDRFVAVLIQQPYVMDCAQRVSISRARVAVGLRPRAAEVSWCSTSAVISGIPAAAPTHLIAPARRYGFGSLLSRSALMTTEGQGHPPPREFRNWPITEMALTSGVGPAGDGVVQHGMKRAGEARMNRRCTTGNRRMRAMRKLPVAPGCRRVGALANFVKSEV